MQTWIGKTNRATRRRVEQFGLLPAVASALAGGVFVAWLSYQIVQRYNPVSDAKAAPIDITRVALTAVAGVGGVIALVIAYRRQRDIEEGRFVERFGAAAAQLGATDVAVRLAGVYAMAGVADQSAGRRRQQCIDVLCGYLRLPYDSDQGSSGRTKLVVKAPRVERGRVRGETEVHTEYRQNDREVRNTIVRVVADHLRPEADYSWSPSDFDFRSAYLEDVNFSSATFSGATWFMGATFSGTTLFDGTAFCGDTGFGNATFSGATWFRDATASGNVDFTEATFSDIVGFRDAKFSGHTSFFHTTFSGFAGFLGVKFFGDVIFNAGTQFLDDAFFNDVMFFGDADFTGATFSGHTGFAGATFADSARFGGASFSGPVRFVGATFSKAAHFGGAVFLGTAEFEDAAFRDETDFAKATFGTGSVSFVDPKCWGPPEPVFDWVDDVSRKPANVEPHTWPPTAVPS